MVSARASRRQRSSYCHGGSRWREGFKYCTFMRKIPLHFYLLSVYGKMIKSITESQFEDIEEHIGFRAGRSSIHNILTLKLLYKSVAQWETC